MGYGVVWLAVPLLAWVAVLFLRPNQSMAMRYVLALTGLALGLTLGVEFVVLVGDIGRQNTVFKFYIQAWIFFAVAAGVGFAALWQATDWWDNALRSPWFVMAALLFAAAALYPIMATRARALDRMVADLPLTLDGMDYMQRATHYEQTSDQAAVAFSLAGDYGAIRWLQDNVVGSPVIMEAMSAAEYRWGNRISINTGLPAVGGWRWHQTQQRGLTSMPDLVNQRVANTNAFYVTPNIDTAWRILRFYNVRYVVVGQLERGRYISQTTDAYTFDGIRKFDQMVTEGLLTVVYEDAVNQTVIYQVNVGAEPPSRLVNAGQ
jgi:uncharacterized membrane protein